MTDPLPDIEPTVTVPGRVWDAVAKTLDAERERADAWEQRCARLTEKVTALYEAFGVRLTDLEAAQDRQAQLLQGLAHLHRSPEAVDDMNDQHESHAAHQGDL